MSSILLLTIDFLNQINPFIPRYPFLLSHSTPSQYTSSYRGGVKFFLFFFTFLDHFFVHLCQFLFHGFYFFFPGHIPSGSLFGNICPFIMISVSIFKPASPYAPYAFPIFSKRQMGLCCFLKYASNE